MHESSSYDATLFGTGDGADTAIYRQLRDAIVSGQYEPGDRLPAEREMVEKLRASRSNVRRAVQRLEREGRVVRYVGRGTFVFSPTPKVLLDNTLPAGTASPLDVLEARLAIEPGFADLIVARAGPRDFERMSDRLDQMAAAKSQQEFRELGYQFHMLLAQSTRNPIIRHFFEQIIEARVAAGWGRLQGLNSTPEDREAQVAANRAVLNALIARDAELARKLLRKHLGQMVASVAFQEEL